MKTTKFALIAALTISGILAPQTASAARPSDDPVKTDTSDATVRGGAESGNRPQEVFIGLVEAHDAHLSGGDVSGHVTWKLLSGTSRKLQVRSSLRAQTSWFSYSTMFFRNVGTWGGIAPVRYYLEDLIELVVDRKINPGRVFDLQLPLADVAEAYAAMDERRATKVLLWP